jgi:hypothetical protein
MRIIYIKNNTEESKTWFRDFTPGEEFQIPSEVMREEYASCESLLIAIANGEALIGNGNEYFSTKYEMFCWLLDTGLSSNVTASVVIDTYAASSLAVDKNGEDQNLSGNDWTVLTDGRKIWDINNDYDEETDDFIIPYDGIYFHDGQFKLINLSGVTEVELAIFKRGAEGVDDYWFILDKKSIPAGATEMQLASGTSFDFYTDERYCLKIKLYGENPSAIVDGDDDFTAWGYTFNRRLG